MRGGLATFFTMAYIVVLNPLIIGTQADSTGQFLGGGTAPNLDMVAAATALVAGVMTLLMGVVANYPLALATGLGLNAFVTFGVAKLPEMTWADAMGLVVLEGIIITVLVLTGFRQAVFRAIPAQLKTAISVGIGLFITIIGLVDAGFVRKPASGPVPVELGVGGFLTGWPLMVFVVGLFAIIAMMVKRVKGAILYGIIGATVLAVVVESIANIGGQTDETGKVVNPAGWGLNVPAIPETMVGRARLRPARPVQPAGLVLQDRHRRGVPAGLHPAARRLLRHHGHDGRDRRRGRPARQGRQPAQRRADPHRRLGRRHGRRCGVGVVSNTSYIESASGVGEGARTGLASVVTGVLFLLATLLAPLVAIVPYEAATPALVIVGLPDDAAGQGHRLGRPRDRDPGVPHHRAHAVHLLDHRRHRRGLHHLRLHQDRPGQDPADPPADVAGGSGLFVVYFAIDPIRNAVGL